MAVRRRAAAAIGDKPDHPFNVLKKDDRVMFAGDPTVSGRVLDKTSALLVVAWRNAARPTHYLMTDPRVEQIAPWRDR